MADPTNSPSSCQTYKFYPTGGTSGGALYTYPGTQGIASIVVKLANKRNVLYQ